MLLLESIASFCPNRVIASTASSGNSSGGPRVTSFDLNLVEAGLFSSVSVGLWARNRYLSRKTMERIIIRKSSRRPEKASLESVFGSFSLSLPFPPFKSPPSPLAPFLSSPFTCSFPALCFLFSSFSPGVLVAATPRNYSEREMALPFKTWCVIWYCKSLKLLYYTGITVRWVPYGNYYANVICNVNWDEADEAATMIHLMGSRRFSVTRRGKRRPERLLVRLGCVPLCIVACSLSSRYGEAIRAP